MQDYSTIFMLPPSPSAQPDLPTRPSVDEQLCKRIRVTLSAAGTKGYTLEEFIKLYDQDWKDGGMIRQLAREAGFKNVTGMLLSMAGAVRCWSGEGKLMVAVEVTKELARNLRDIDDATKESEERKKMRKRLTPARVQSMPFYSRVPLYRAMPKRPPLHPFSHLPTPNYYEVPELPSRSTEWHLPRSSSDLAPSVQTLFRANPNKMPLGRIPGFPTQPGQHPSRRVEHLGFRPIMGYAHHPPPAHLSFPTGRNAHFLPGAPLFEPPSEARNPLHPKVAPWNQLSPSTANCYRQLLEDFTSSPYCYGSGVVDEHAARVKDLPEDFEEADKNLDRLRYSASTPPAGRSSPLGQIAASSPLLPQPDADGEAYKAQREFKPYEEELRPGLAAVVDMTVCLVDRLRYELKRAKTRKTKPMGVEWTQAECSGLSKQYAGKDAGIPPKLHRIVQLLRAAEGQRLQFPKLQEGYKKRYGNALSTTELAECLGAKGAKNSLVAFQNCAIPGLFSYTTGVLNAVVGLRNDASDSAGDMLERSIPQKSNNLSPNNPVDAPTRCTPGQGASQPNVRSLARSLSLLLAPTLIPSSSIAPAPTNATAPYTEANNLLSPAPSSPSPVNASRKSSEETASSSINKLLELVTLIYQRLQKDEWVTMPALLTYFRYPTCGKEPKLGMLDNENYLAGMLLTHFAPCFKFQPGTFEQAVRISKVANAFPMELASTLEPIHPLNLRLVDEPLLVGGHYKVVLVKLLSESDAAPGGTGPHFTFRLASRNNVYEQLNIYLSDYAAKIKEGGGEHLEESPLPEQPLLYLTERNRLLRCRVVNNWESRDDFDDGLLLECVDSGELIENAELERMYEFPADFPFERFTSSITHAELMDSSLLCSREEQAKTVQRLREMLRSKKSIELEVVGERKRTPFSKTLQVHLFFP